MKTWHWLLLGGLVYWLYSRSQGTAFVGPDVQYGVHPVTGQSVPAGTVQPQIDMTINNPQPLVASGGASGPMSYELTNVRAM